MIDSVSRSMCFKGIRYGLTKNLFNPDQQEVAESIIEQFNKIDLNLKKQSRYIDKYKKYDFFMIPNDRYLDSDSVFLYARTPMEIIGSAGNYYVGFTDSVLIKSYDKERKFNITDIEEFVKKDNSNLLKYLFRILSILLIGLLSYGGVKLINKSIDVKRQPKTVLNDTINVVPKFSIGI